MCVDNEYISIISFLGWGSVKLSPADDFCSVSHLCPVAYAKWCPFALGKSTALGMAVRWVTHVPDVTQVE